MGLPIPTQVIDLRGRTFGRLTVREFVGLRNHDSYWVCDCECGTVGKEVRGKSLRTGRTVSCGCQRSDPLIRQAARLTMTALERSAAAGGITVRRPVIVRTAPTSPPQKTKPLLPLLGDERNLRAAERQTLLDALALASLHVDEANAQRIRELHARLNKAEWIRAGKERDGQ